MNKINIFIVVLFVITCYACKKDSSEHNNVPIAKINVIHAAVGASPLKINVSGKALSWGIIPEALSYGANNLYITPTGNVPLQAVALSDTTKLLFNRNANLQDGKMYTMYISGTATAMDTMFREETAYPPLISLDALAPHPAADSIVNLRFVNLSSTSPMVNINIKNNVTNEASNLAYQGITPFKSYPVRLVSGNTFIFEARNATTGILIATYTFDATSSRFKNVAIAVIGTYAVPAVTGQNAYKMVAIPYY